MASQQATAGRSARCYNCGANDHFMMACPEATRKVPAGLEAARASQAAQAAQAASLPQGHGNPQDSASHRPSKRQKTGPVVTKYPAAGAPPIITRYHQAGGQPATYRGGQDYYVTPTQSYQQQIPYDPPQAQPYAQQGYQQPYGGYGQPAYAQGSQVYSQPMYSAGQIEGQPQTSAPFQGYGYAPQAAQQHPPNAQQPYSQPSGPRTAQQYGYQQPHTPYQSATYQIPVSGQHYEYDSSGQYGQNGNEEYGEYDEYDQTTEQAPQEFIPYENASSNTSSYQNVPQNRPTYSQSQSVHPQGPANDWGRHPNYQKSYGAQPYQNQYGGHQYDSQSPQYQQPQIQRPRSYSQQGPSNHPSTSGSAMSLSPRTQQSQTSLHNGFTTNHQQYSNQSKASRSSSVSSNPLGSHVVTDKITTALSENEHSDLDWEMEMIFAEVAHQDSCPISHPLPTSFDGESIKLPAGNSQGLVTKYVRPGNQYIFVLPIDKSLHWATLRFDPVFKPISHDEPSIPLNELEAWLLEQHRRTGLPNTPAADNSKHSPISYSRERSEDEQEDIDKQISTEASLFGQEVVEGTSSSIQRECLEDIPTETTNIDRSGTPTLNRSTTPALGRAGTPALVTEDDAWAPQPGEGQDAPITLEDPTEALLASLGVTGAPKPVSEGPVDFYPPPPIGAQAYQEEVSLQEAQNRGPSRQDSGYASARGSCSNASPSGGENGTNRIEYRQTQWGGQPQPPPPPPPRYLRKQYEEPLESPPYDGSNRDNHQNHKSTSTDGSHRNEGSATYYPVGSPLTPTSTELVNPETAVHERQNGRKAEPLRQIDDVTPKLKRRQPKVADAYNRRW